jgi:glycosyltransferase involved in cell wall biosynthesis
MSKPTTYVIVPTYNEADNLDQLFGQLLTLPVNLGIVNVDDGSPDGTGALADAWATKYPERVHVIHRQGKLGLGTAYIAGFRYALETLAAENVMTMDADFSHNPRYIPAMIDLIGEKHVVIGSRYVAGGGTLNWPPARIWLSAISNFVARTLLGLKARDTTAGFRLYRREVLQSIPLDRIFSSGYSFLVEMLFLCERRGWQVGEVPIIFEDRREGTTKISRNEIFKAQYTIFRLLARRLLKRAPRHSAEMINLK